MDTEREAAVAPAAEGEVCAEQRAEVSALAAGLQPRCTCWRCRRDLLAFHTTPQRWLGPSWQRRRYRRSFQRDERTV